MNKNGFTIIELGVVVVLIAVIVAGLTPFVKIVKRKTCNIICENNLQRISIALRVYAHENEGKAPKDLSFLYTKGYLDSEKVFDCPYLGGKGTAAKPDYDYIGEFDFGNPDNISIVYDREKHPDGTINVLYLNGEIKPVRQ